MRAIIYTSNTGSTAQYAEQLGKELKLPVYDATIADRKLQHADEIIYLGWIMAGKVKGYVEFSKKYKILAVCAVGMGQTGTQEKEIREKNAIPQDVSLFTLQGNFDIKKLHGIYRFMMSVMVKTAGRALAKKENRTPEEEDMLDMITHNGQRVKKENLKAVVSWYQGILS